MWKVYPKSQSGQVYYFSLLHSNLWRIAIYERHYFEKTTQIVSDFFGVSIFLKVGKFVSFTERPKAKSVSASASGGP